MKSPTPIPRSDDPPDSYLTLAEAVAAELKVQRSRFLAQAIPITSPEDAQTFLDETARRYHDARHVCYGYRLGVGQGMTTRKSDDGEPSGTAGEPILTAIGQLDLTDVLVMVIRYFGGIKLGTGGLARAYGQAAADALSLGTVRKERGTGSPTNNVSASPTGARHRRERRECARLGGRQGSRFASNRRSAPRRGIRSRTDRGVGPSDRARKRAQCDG